MTTNDQYRNDQFANDQYAGDQLANDQLRQDQYTQQDQYAQEAPTPPPPPQEPYDQRDAAYREPPAYQEPAAYEEPRAYDEPVPTEAPVREPESVDRQTDTGEVLFASADLSGLRSHWDEVQATFVDDPQQCVRQADALVSDVVEKLTSSFGTTRTRLEAQWAGGEEVSTEDLRVALTQYREFFQRLLAV